MDRPIQKRPFPTQRQKLALAALALVVLGGAALATFGGGKTYRIEGQRLSIGEVKSGRFEDVVMVRGAVAPRTSVYLDAVEGGRVERVLTEAGQPVKKGDALVELSNTALQLDVIGREAQVIEQVNQLRSRELLLAETRLQNARDLNETEYQITRLTRLVGRRDALAKTGAVSQADLDAARDELAYQQKKRALLMETKKVEDDLRARQVDELADGVKKLEANLAFARRNLDNLTVRSPVDGVLTALDAQPGESKSQGQRLGQIDGTDGFKVKADVDEFYLSRVQTGQKAEVELDGRNYALTLTKALPQVKNGTFEAELEFDGTPPAGVRRGQTLQLRLTLAEPVPALVMPAGPFLQETNGRWAFVVDEGGTSAVKRDIRIGRRTSQTVEILDGLKPGEKVILSDYRNFAGMDRLVLEGQ